MMDRSSFLYKYFLDHFTYEPTSCQENLLRDMSDFFTSDDGDIMVVNGYAGTGKTTAVAAVVNSLKELETPCILLAPTGRSAKVLSSYTGHPAFTIHKHIYRQKSHGDDGFGLFTLGPNKSKNTLFIVDEVSLIGIDSQSSGAAFGSGNLLEDLVNFVRSGVDCRLVLIGDSAQLKIFSCSDGSMKEVYSATGFDEVSQAFPEYCVFLINGDSSLYLYESTLNAYAGNFYFYKLTPQANGQLKKTLQLSATTSGPDTFECKNASGKITLQEFYIAASQLTSNINEVMLSGHLRDTLLTVPSSATDSSMTYDEAIKALNSVN